MVDQEIYSAIHLGLPKANWQGKVLVVGAGVAGLCAAQILIKSGFDVEILEATGRWGGRIWSEKDFIGQNIERGAEEIHGANSIWYKIIQNYGFTCDSYGQELEDYYFVNNQLFSESELAKDPDFQKAFAVWDGLDDYQPTQNQTLADYIQEQAVPHHTRFIPEAIWAAEYGTSIQNINMKSFLEVRDKWKSGEENFILKDATFSDVLEKAFEDAIAKVQLHQIVHKVDYCADKITVLAGSRQSFLVDKVLITAPIGILKSNLIGFTPALPQEKLDGIQQLCIDSGIKIILKFRQPFWAKDTGSIYGTGLISEFYTSSSNPEILTGFVMGEKAKELSELSENQVIIQVLGELGNMFSRGITRAELEDYRITDWGKEQFIAGAYSYPAQDTEQNREILATPVANKLYFAGEATNMNGQPATVQGAIESAYRAVKEIIEEED